MEPTERPALPVLMRMAAHPVRWALLTVLAGGDHRVRELVATLGETQNLVSYHLRVLRSSGLVRANRSTFDGRDTYYHLDLARCAAAFGDAARSLHPALAPGGAGPPKTGGSVLFLCTGNSARSPIAEALLRQHAGGRVRVTSAGSHPKPGLHPFAVRILNEDYGIDIAGQRPRALTALTGHRFDHAITLCDKVREFPHRPTATTATHWSIPDPASVDYPEFRSITTELDTRIRYLLPALITSEEPS